jgi:Ca2+-binding RTX toxin-like protein
MTVLTVFDYTLDMFDSREFDAQVTDPRDDFLGMTTPEGDRFGFNGGGFKYDDDHNPTEGTVVSFIFQHNMVNSIEVKDFNLSVEQISADLNSPGDNFTIFQRDLFSGTDTLSGQNGDDYLIGYNGNDSLYGGLGNDTLDGDEAGVGAGGNDTIDGANGNDVIRGLNGNDIIYGGAGNDDVNGNQGDDTVYGGDNIDIVRGGQGNDIVYGDANADAHLNGNVGNDTVYGGDSQDAVFGGQGDDRLFGDNGNDTLSGDLGNDTLTGGAGGDRFVMGAVTPGFDVVTDFTFSEGDRIQLTTGTTYTVSTVSGNAVLNLSNGGTLTLQGIAAASVQSSWIVFG